MQDDNKPVSGGDQPGQVVAPNSEPTTEQQMPLQSPNIEQPQTEAPAEVIQTSSETNPLATQPSNYQPNITPQPTLQNQAPPDVPSQKKRSLKLPILVVVVLSFLLASSAGAYFGIVAPNKPENVWADALVNMGKAYDELSEQSSEMLQSKGTNVSGDFTYSSGDTNLVGDFSVKSYEAESMVEVNISEDDFSAKIDVMTITPEGKSVPNLYARIDELNNFDKYVNPEAASLYESYVDQWFVLDASELTDELIEEQNETVYTETDYQEVIDAVGSTLKEYVFTADKSKAVISLDEVVGSETNYDQPTYHYKAKVVKENFNAFEQKLTENILATKAGASINDQITADDFFGEIESIDEPFDMWINKQTKLIQAIRLYDEDEKSYVGIGQLFEGGNIIPIFVNAFEKSNDDNSNGEFSIKLNFNKDANTAELTSNYKTANPNVSFNLSSNISTSNEQLELAVPNEAVSFWTLIFGEYYQDISQLQESTLGLSTPQDISTPLNIANQAKDLQTFVGGLLQWLQLTE